MSNEVQTAPQEANVASLMRGIINDIGDLIRHEVRFARKEITSDLRKLQRAALVLALGVWTGVLGSILFVLMLVYLLNWLSLPAGTVTEGIPLWGCFGIVSAVLLVIGSIMGLMGCQMWQNITPVGEKTVQNVKENVEWMTNSK